MCISNPSLANSEPNFIHVKLLFYPVNGDKGLPLLPLWTMF